MDTKEWDFPDKRVLFELHPLVADIKKSRKGNAWRDAHFSVCTSRHYETYLFNGGWAARQALSFRIWHTSF